MGNSFGTGVVDAHSVRWVQAASRTEKQTQLGAIRDAEQGEEAVKAGISLLRGLSCSLKSNELSLKAQDFL